MYLLSQNRPGVYFGEGIFLTVTPGTSTISLFVLTCTVVIKYKVIRGNECLKVPNVVKSTKASNQFVKI